VGCKCLKIPACEQPNTDSGKLYFPVISPSICNAGSNWTKYRLPNFSPEDLKIPCYRNALFCKDYYKMNKIQKLSIAKFTVSDFFDFAASENFIKVLKERYFARLSIDHATNKFFFVSNHTSQWKLGLSRVTSSMLLIRYKRHGEDYCFYVRDRTGSPLFYSEDGESTSKLFLPTNAPFIKYIKR